MQCDAYCATLPYPDGYPRPHMDCHDSLMDALADLKPRSQAGPGMQGYLHAFKITDDLNNNICSIYFGGSNGINPHVRSQGHYSPTMATTIRKIFPRHSVSRVDVAVDYDSGQDTWDRLYSVCDAFSRGRTLKVAHNGDWRPEGVRDTSSGRTLYLGSRTSVSYFRLYEKGKQLISSAPTDPSISPNWVRAEIEVKPPNKASKSLAATLPMQQFWGTSRWTRDLLNEIDGTKVERVTMKEHKEHDPIRSLRHMFEQYRKALEWLIETEGEPAILALMHDHWGRMDRGETEPLSVP